MVEKNLEEEDLISLEEVNNEDLQNKIREEFDKELEKKASKVPKKNFSKKKDVVESTPIIVYSNTSVSPVVLTPTLYTIPPIVSNTNIGAVGGIVENIEAVIVYTISYKLGDSPLMQCYTYVQPVLNKDSISITDAFKKSILTESVLGKKKVEVKYRENIDDFELSLEEGIYIEALKEEKWMYSSKEKAEQSFEKHVLQAYRTVSKELEAKVVPTKQVAPAKQIVKNEGNTQDSEELRRQWADKIV